jgi:hypothetical protein
MRTMVYACRICPYHEVGDNNCVYRNDLLTVTKCVLCSSTAQSFPPSAFPLWRSLRLWDKRADRMLNVGNKWA